MGHGFLAGSFWGGLIGLVMLFVSTQVVERQQLSLPKPAAEPVEVPAGTEFDQARPETDPVVPDAETAPAAEQVSDVTAPEEVEETPPAVDTAALDVPQAPQNSPVGLGDAPIASSDPSIEAASEETVTEPVQGALAVPDSPTVAPAAETGAPEDVAAPGEPEAGSDVEIVATEETTDVASEQSDLTTPDPGAAPETVAAPVEAVAVETTDTAPEMAGPAQQSENDFAAFLDSVGESPVTPAASAPQIGTASAPELPGVQFDAAAVEAPEVPEPSQASGLDVSQSTDAPPSRAEAPQAVEVDIAAGPETTPEPDQPSTPESSISVPDVSVTEAPAATSEPEAPKIEAQEEPPLVVAAAPEPEPEPTAPSATVETPSQSARTTESEDRPLPVVRRLGQSEAEEEPAQAETELVEDVLPDDAPAILRNRIAFENPEAKPVVAIVLVHEGGALDNGVISALPEGITFAVDAGGAGAREVARSYRSAGREIVMIPSLPAGATPQDVEVALQANFAAIPSAVAVIDVDGSGFQADRSAVGQVVDVVAASGHGLITFPRGLNTAHQEAGRAGVPTGLIFRDIDGGSETAPQIQRALDRAAFRARQNDAVILVGRTEPNTLRALTDWVSAGRANDVVLAPVSAALESDG